MDRLIVHGFSAMPWKVTVRGIQMAALPWGVLCLRPVVGQLAVTFLSFRTFVLVIDCTFD
jgi:hypothetical protein